MKQLDYDKLLKIKSKVDILQKKKDWLVSKAEKITGDDSGNITFDWILNDYGTLDEVLTKLDIEVEP